jgi:arylsulfatase A-like enzyme
MSKMSIAFAGLLACACTVETPDVILLTVDTLRVDHVSAFHPESPIQTPAIDALAADGVRYSNAYSPISVTAPAFASVLTGEEPGQHGVLMNVFRGGAPLAETKITLAERLSDAGYKTAGFVSAYTLRREVGLAQGFGVYNGGRRANRWGNRTAKLALAWLELQEGPLMLWYHSYDPHGPVKRFSRPPERETGWVRDPANVHHLPEYQLDGEITDPAYYSMLYQRGVTLADKQVGRIVAALKASKRYDDAMIIVLADHGEGFSERPLWFDHGTSSHEEQLHVPLIIKYPKNVGAGDVDARLVSLIDVAPTVLDVLKQAPLQEVAGRTLRSEGTLHEQLAGESSHCKRVAVLPCSPHGGLGKEVSIRSLRHVAVRQSRGAGARYIVYDRVSDPAERTPVQILDVAANTPVEGLAVPAEMATSLAALSQDRLEREYAALLEMNPRAPAEEHEKLKSLGYVE